MSYPDPLDIRSQERAQAEAEERMRLASQCWAGDIKWLMSDKRGRRIAAVLLDQAGTHRSPFDTNHASADFKQGLQWFGLWWKGQLEKHCFDRFIEMLKESKES